MDRTQRLAGSDDTLNQTTGRPFPQPASGWLLSVELHTLPGESHPGPRRGEALVAPSEALLVEARARGLKIAVAAHDPASYAPKYHDLVDTWVKVDTSEPGEILDSASSLAGGVAAVTSSVDNFIRVAAIVADKVGAPGPNPASAAIQRDKSLAREALRAAGLPDAAWGVVPAADPDLRSPIGYPAVAKPVDGAASWDVALVESDDQARALAARHLRREYGRGVNPRRQLLFEEYLDGPVFSAEGIVTDAGMRIFGYSSRVMGPEPYFVELALAFAPDPPTPGTPAFVEAVLSALGHTWGPFHLEFALTAQGLRLIENNSRFVGAGLQHAIHRLAGTPLARNLLEALLDEPLSPMLIEGACCEMRLISKRDGVLQEVDGLDEAASVAGVHAVGLFDPIGGLVTAKVDTNSARIGYVHASGPTRDGALAQATRAVECIRLRVEPR